MTKTAHTDQDANAAFGSHTNTYNVATEPDAAKQVATMDLKQHPLSAAWPPMPDDEFQLLVDSIDDLGVLNPITIADGMVLDGWNRYRAATQLLMPCPQVHFDESMDIVKFVDAQNDSRRHITKSQRAAAVVIMHGYVRPNRPKNKQVPGTYLSTVAALAAEAGVGDKTIKDAIAADKAGLIDDVRTGKMTAKAAAKKARASKPKKGKPSAKPAKPKAEAKPTKPALSVVQPPKEDEYTDLDAALDQVKDLQDALVVASMGDVSDEDRGQAKTLIAELRARIKALEQTLRAVTISRDTYQAENVQLHSQINRQRREIDKVTGRKTA